MNFQKTAVAVVVSAVVLLKTAVAVITYNFNSTKNWRKNKHICSYMNTRRDTIKGVHVEKSISDSW